eukprot:10168386-Lingulodinium_polyedra.AAC.1
MPTASHASPRNATICKQQSMLCCAVLQLCTLAAHAHTTVAPLLRCAHGVRTQTARSHTPCADQKL